MPTPGGLPKLGRSSLKCTLSAFERGWSKHVEDFDKSLSSYQSLRANLTMMTSFWRQATLSGDDLDAFEDFDFLLKSLGMEQQQAHNWAVNTILYSLTSQALSNYQELKRLSPRLVDGDIEAYMDELGNDAYRALRIIRNAPLHGGAVRGKKLRTAESFIGGVRETWWFAPRHG